MVHHTGPLLEENHYYPFGLAMAAISAKALKTNYTENKLRYNGGSEMQNKEFSDGSGLEMYETSFRGYDAQIGRFGQIDPMAGRYLDYSSYAYTANNPILFSDPSGAKYQFQQPTSWYPILGSSYGYYERLLTSGGPGGSAGMGGSIGGGGYNGAPGYGENTGSSWSVVTGQAPTEFEKSVDNFNFQLDSYIEKEAQQQQKDNAVSAFVASLPDGETTFTADIAMTKLCGYFYANERGHEFVTDDYHGEMSHTEGEDYHSEGEVLKENLSDALKGLQIGDGKTEESNGGLETPAAVVNLGIDVVNVSFSGAGTLAKSSLSGLKVATHSTGLIGVVLGGGLAVHDMIHNGLTWSNVTSFSLGIASACILFIPGLGEVAEGVSLVVDASALTLDSYQLARDLRPRR